MLGGEAQMDGEAFEVIDEAGLPPESWRVAD